MRKRTRTEEKKTVTATRFELVPFRTGALNRRLRPLGHAAMLKKTQDNRANPNLSALSDAHF